ncbi:MAG: type II toxin-antitoxin system Phd/YefM family antitoxin [Polyangiaceae bacterium]|nr:type II toxin-antitoxin system Phd/YefM family antitoxin [Polyangiaceae bacterium]
MADQIESAPPNAWQVQEAKARFSELLRASIEDGPQTVTRRGVPLAVLVSVEEWNARQKAASPTLKDLLLSATGRSNELVPPRERMNQRPSIRLR